VRILHGRRRHGGPGRPGQLPERAIDEAAAIARRSTGQVTPGVGRSGSSIHQPNRAQAIGTEEGSGKGRRSERQDRNDGENGAVRHRRSLRGPPETRRTPRDHPVDCDGHASPCVTVGRVTRSERPRRSERRGHTAVGAKAPRIQGLAPRPTILSTLHAPPLPMDCGQSRSAPSRRRRLADPFERR
jgi:hypothetical protein